MVGLGTDVSLDRQQDPRACVLLHARDLAAAVHPQTGRHRLAGSFHGTTAARVRPDAAVHLALPATGSKRSATHGHRAFQTYPPAASVGRRTGPGSALSY